MNEGSGIQLRGTATFSIDDGFYFLLHPDTDYPAVSMSVASSDLIRPDVDLYGGALIVTGLFSGPFEVTFEILAEDPGQLWGEAGYWERIEEKTLQSKGTDLIVSHPFYTIEELPRFSIKPGQGRFSQWKHSPLRVQ